MASIGSATTYIPPAMPAGSGTRRDPEPDTEIDRVRTLARVLDRYYLDPLLGLLLPGGGDVLGSLLGIYTVVLAARRRLSPVVIARMLMNLAADAAIGFIPLIGDVFDFGFKAHVRNLDLIADRSLHGGRATARDWLVVIGASLAYLAVMALVVWGIVALLRAIF
jgi:hypothetical protein